MKKFVLIGAAGYIAERHIRAIKETGNDLVAAMDPFDVMGRMDSFFPDAEYFQNEDQLVEFLKECLVAGKQVDFISICSPNFLHIKHIELALKNGCDVICEKPLVIDSSDLDKIKKLEKETGKKVNTVLQLRYHPTILQLKKEIEQSEKEQFNIDLKYITSRGKWYQKSWKADIEKSGGIAINIGIHFFDMLTWIFGDVKKNDLSLVSKTKAIGTIDLEKAKVSWFLSIDENDLPDEAILYGKRTFRSIKVDGKEVEFSDGFTDLHTVTYQNILDGKGFGVEDALESIDMTQIIRKSSSH